ncbi:MAG TPA: adenylate/guanylate cyclase domain-containing protein [Bacteroidota bacterium]|nr:adenylate/guanylate cyclase domain-containing protein [Bacteroidota bacterium]
MTFQRLQRKSQQKISTAKRLPLTTNKTRTWRDTLIISVSALALGHFLFWLLPGIFQTWNGQAADQMFVLRSHYFPSRIPYDSTIIHVCETDSTKLVLTSSYTTRKPYAQIIRNLGDLKAAMQVWDYIFRDPLSSDEDSTLIESSNHANNVYFGAELNVQDDVHKQRMLQNEYLSKTKWHVQVAGDISRMYVGANPISTFAALASSSRGVGYLNVKFDRDGIFRRAPLLIRYEDGFYPSFPFHAICDYLHVPPEHITVCPGKNITLQGAYRPGQPPHDIRIPVDEHCNLIVNFVGPWDRMLHYTMLQLYHVSDDRDAMEFDWQPQFEGKIVVVNETSTGASDIQSVPTESWYPLGGLHANVMNTILTENFLHEINPWAMVGIELVLLTFIVFFTIKFSSRGMWIGAIALLVSYVLIALAVFLYGNLIINIVRPIVICTAAVFGVLAYRFINEEREKESLRQSFESYLPPSVVKRQLAHPETVLEVQKKELTILFSDIKSFTTYSSTMTPDQIQKFLAEYFEAMVNIVFKYEGTVDKYIGDGLMVFFGAPEPQPDHAVRCVRAAIEMQKKCRELKEKWVREGLFPLRIRIGVNTGEVVVGNMGTPKKLSYTVLGSDVNLANRLESNAPVEGIMISRRTYELIKDHIPTLPHEKILVKGLDTPIEVFTVPVDEQLQPST